MSFEENYDYIVVGGGSSGCIVAARLAQANVGKVLIIEAGDLAENNPDTLSADGFIHAFAAQGNVGGIKNDFVIKMESALGQLNHGAGRSGYKGFFQLIGKIITGGKLNHFSVIVGMSA